MKKIKEKLKSSEVRMSKRFLIQVLTPFIEGIKYVEDIDDLYVHNDKDCIRIEFTKKGGVNSNT